MSKTVGKLQIKADWDEKISWYKDNPVTASSLELNALRKIRAFLLRNTSGSLIVSGVRGAGKTTSLITAVRSCEKDAVIFPVYLNSVHLEAISDGNDNVNFQMFKVLQALIKSLTRELEKKRSKIPQELLQLIHDCEATKISISESYYEKNKYDASTKVGVKMNFMGNIGEYLGIGGGYESAMNAEAKFGDLKNSQWEKMGITIEDVVERFSEVIKILEKNKILNAEVIKPKTLHFRAQKWQFKFLMFKPRELNVQKKLVFIIDELDAYDGDGASSVSPEDVLGIIKKFKNLFTLSAGQFIFIVGKNTYLKARFDPYRTQFSERIFLSKPDGEMLADYLDTVIIGNVTGQLRDLWENWKWKIISKSDHNLYDLICLVNSYTTYDETEKKLWIELPELTTIEKQLGAFHYLLNTTFNYFRQSSILEHFNDNLLEELFVIENKLEAFLLEGVTQTINFTPNDTGNIEVNKVLIDAKMALLRTLYLFINVKPPEMSINAEHAIPFESYLPILNLDKVRQGIAGGAITPTEQGFLKDIEGFLLRFNKFYGKYLKFTTNSSNLDLALSKLSAMLLVEFNQNDILIVKKALEQITSSPVEGRDWEIIKQSPQSLSSIASVLVHFLQFGDDFMLKYEWGLIQIDEGKISLGNDPGHGNKLLSRTTMFLPGVAGCAFEITAKVNLSAGALLNILLYKEYATTEVESDFYMVRLDSREPKSTFGDCILYKPKGSYWDVMSDSYLIRTGSKANQDIEIKILLDANVLTFKKKVGKNYHTIARAKTDGVVRFIGFSNEVEKLEIKSFQLKINSKMYK